MDAFSQEELNALGCSPEGSDSDEYILYMDRSFCHDAGVRVRYEKPLGQIVISCAFCDREVIRIAVRETRP